VGNLSWRISWQDLKDTMREAGDVLHADIMQDHMGRSRGCGIVVFSSPEEASFAIQRFHDFELDGRKMLVREDREEGKVHTPRVVNQAPAGGASSMAAAYAGSPGTNVYVGNLPWKVDVQELSDFMQSAGGEVKHAEIMRDGIGRSKGCGIVRFATAEQARQAIDSLNEQEMEGRYIIVREDREEAKFRNSVTVSATGLPAGITWQKVKDHFRSCGDVLHVDTEADGEFTNAFVRFSNEPDADAAVSTMNGTEFEGNIISVERKFD
jgi:RNA recognition motif-containing protein